MADDAYRPNVGIALFGPDGRVQIAHRTGDDGPETVAPGREWQMPQGGIEPDEDPERAARRELREETGIVSAETIGVMPVWLSYDFPPYKGPTHRLARFRGQRQLWFAMRFTGNEREIDLTRSEPGLPPEFDAWRWERLGALVDLVVPFKRQVYAEVAQLFSRLAPGRTADRPGGNGSRGSDLRRPDSPGQP